MRIQDVVIDAELESFLPCLQDEERASLKEQIARDGFTDPLVVWMNHGVLVDGHNRYRIWQELGGDEDRCPDILEKKFSDKMAVMEWMYSRQGARRNWTPAQRAAVALKMKPAIAERAKENQREKPGKSTLPNSAKLEVNTRKEVAKIAGVSGDTVRKTEVVLKDGSKEVKDALQSGKMSANKAYAETRKISGGTKFDPSEFEEGAKPTVKNGSPIDGKFNERKIDKPLGELVRAVTERMKLRPSGSGSECRKFLESFCVSLENWRSGK